ncbi:MAG TPA: DUF2914 domain-containing protein [Candidatus Paceibacterota bacterium]
MLKQIFHSANIKSFYTKYESHIGAAAILLGFIFDNLTLRDASIGIQTVIFTTYLILAGISIALLYLIEASESGKDSYAKFHFWLFLLMQFAIGSLFSMFFVFYSRGISIATSWPFLLLLLANMIGTEVMKKHYSRLSLQVAMLFVAVFSFCIYFVPTVVHRMNISTFFLGGVMAVALILLFLRLLVRISSKRIEEGRDNIALGILIVYVLMNLLYFTNTIPPVPLVMKDGGVYHSFYRSTGGEYIVLEEKKPWLGFMRSFPEYHRIFSEPVYAVTAVYAPAKLETEIIHNWQYYDEEKHRWQSATKIKVPIIGGREGGYRMYSVKYNLFAGKWRVDVETYEGKTIGRIRFKVVNSVTLPALVLKIY